MELNAVKFNFYNFFSSLAIIFIFYYVSSSITHLFASVTHRDNMIKHRTYMSIQNSGHP